MFPFLAMLEICTSYILVRLGRNNKLENVKDYTKHMQRTLMSLHSICPHVVGKGTIGNRSFEIRMRISGAARDMPLIDSCTMYFVRRIILNKAITSLGIFWFVPYVVSFS